MPDRNSTSQSVCHMRPCVYLASSTEGLRIARAVQQHLSGDAEIMLWSEGVFDISSNILDSILAALDQIDFSIIILSPDDTVISRGRSISSPRENIIFELGLFIGRIGRERVLVIQPSNQSARLPTDLSGIMVAAYDAELAANNPVAAVAPACSIIMKVIRNLGPIEKYWSKR